MDGKKTYTFLGAIAASLLVGFAVRHGVDLTVIDQTMQADIAAGVVALLTAGAVWARSVVNRPKIAPDDGKASKLPLDAPL